MHGGVLSTVDDARARGAREVRAARAQDEGERDARRGAVRDADEGREARAATTTRGIGASDGVGGEDVVADGDVRGVSGEV